MPGLDPLSGTFALPWWTIIAVVLLIAVLGVLAGLRGGWLKTIGSLTQLVAVIGLLFVGWTVFDRMIARDAAEQHRSFQTRLADLNSRSLVPPSPLACLDALAGDAIEEPCEKAIFAHPESAAAAVSLMTARLSLLREALAYAAAADHSYDRAIADLRRSLEADRFGFVAQALAAGEQCTPASCAALVLLKDPDRVAANLKDRTFEVYVGRHVAAWMSRSPGAPAVAAAPAQPAPTASAPPAQGAVTPAASAVNVEFPSAASIPAVSIMNNEPGATGQGGTDADAKAAAQRRPAAVPTPRAASRGGNAGSSTSAQ